MSTTLLIGRCPAAIRRALSHGGDGPSRTSSNSRAVKRGHSSESCTSIAKPGIASPGGWSSSAQGGGASGVSVAAWTSRATPYTHRQSGRLGVISSSSTSVAIGSTSASGVPTASPASSTMIPSCSVPMPSSSSARIIPRDSCPRSLARLSFVPSGMTAPGAATATIWPAATFGAPQTICAGSPSPVSTMQTVRRSASGWRSADSTRPTRKCSSAATPWRWTRSTSVPVSASRVASASAGSSGSQ